MKRTITLCSRTVLYELEIKKVKNINLRIRPDLSVHVSAGKNVPVSRIEEFMIEKQLFIINALDKFTQLKDSALKSAQYCENEQFCILGHIFLIRLFCGNRNSVITEGNLLYLTVTDTDDIGLKEKTLYKYANEQLKTTVIGMCEKIYPAFSRYCIQYPEIRFRHMISRWGSCNPSKRILTFSTKLSCVPERCIEYVVTHEFVHFVHPDHSKSFYNTLSGFMPDWKERKKALETNNLNLTGFEG